MAKDHPRLILASSSPWRRELLGRLGIRFETIAPEVNETAATNEAPIDLARRLARAKAERVAAMSPEAVVIGSDQVADVDGAILGKPGTRERAIEQLHRQSGRTVYFHTGLCVCAPALEAPLATVETVTTTFRALSDAEIRRYVAAEDVTSTAGSIKSEGLGIALAESIHSHDPSTLVGLPLIAVRRFLAQAGIAVP